MRDEEPDVTDDEPIRPRLPVGLDLARASWWDTPDPAGEARLMDAIGRGSRLGRSPSPARTRPARRIAIAGLAVAAAAAALLFTGYQWGTRQPPARGTEFALAATGVQPGAAASGQIEATPNGTWIRLDVGELAPAAPGEYYEAWLTDGAAVVSAGTFHMRGAPAPVVLWAGVSPVDYPELLVTLQFEGEPAMSGRVVLRGTVTP
jgi:hypothetical protein